MKGCITLNWNLARQCRLDWFTFETAKTFGIWQRGQHIDLTSRVQLIALAH